MLQLLHFGLVPLDEVPESANLLLVSHPLLVVGLSHLTGLQEVASFVLRLANHPVDLICLFREELEEYVPVLVAEVRVAVLVGEDLEELLELDLGLWVVVAQIFFQAVGEIQTALFLLYDAR